MTSASMLRDRVQAVERLAQLFRVERFIYLAVTGLSFLLLLTIAIRIFLEGGAKTFEWGTLLGSSGLITVTGNRVLQMWSQALRMVASEPIDGKPEEAEK